MKVSFISGFYKRADVVDRTLESMVNQDHDSFEVIVFDDNSPDETFERLSKYSSYSNTNIYQHKNNIGFTKGLLEAVKISQGDYIAIQGSGDVSNLERLKYQAEYLDNNPTVGVVGCHYTNIVEDYGLSRLRTPNADNVTLDTLIKGNVFSHGEVMFRRSYYEQAGGYNEAYKFCQDYNLWLRMIKSCRFSTIKRNLYSRYIQFDGVSYDPNKFIYQARYYLLCQRLTVKESDEEIVPIESKLLSDGPMDIIHESDSGLQDRIIKASLRLSIWGNCKNGYLLSERIKNPIKRSFVKIIISLLGSKIMRLPMKLIYKYLGVKTLK